MSDGYNGWTNYATWRVNLEVFDGMNARDLSGRRANKRDELAEMAEAHVQEILESTSSGMALGYALAFVAEVNWREIADSLMEATSIDYVDGEEDD